MRKISHKTMNGVDGVFNSVVDKHTSSCIVAPGIDSKVVIQ